MKLRLATLSVAFLLGWCLAAQALDAPKIIPRSARVAKPVAKVFALLKTYFSDSALSGFHLVSTDSAKHELVASRSAIDAQTWDSWAFCKVGTPQMLYSLKQGLVTLKVTVEPSADSAAFVTVSADLTATYAMGSAESQVRCLSKGILEQNILSVAGASKPAKSQ